MRILLADDHDLLRDTLVAYLDAEGGLETSTAASFDEACAYLSEARPFDLVLLDFRMPGMRGLDGLRRALEMEGCKRVALISGEASRETAERALEMGAAGFIPKTLPARSLVNAIKFMAMGEQYAPLDFMTAADDAAPSEALKELTGREMDVLRGVSQGLSNKEIARSLTLSEPTIKLHLKTLYRKLGVGNRTQAALIAREEGLG